VGLFVVSLGIAGWLGIEFVPRLDEGDMAIQVWRLPSVSLSESVRTALDVERVVRQFPEVVQVVTRTGSPEVATDVMGVELSDVFVILKPQREWTTAGYARGSDRQSEARHSRSGSGRQPRVYATDRDALQRIDRGQRAQISPSKYLGLIWTCSKNRPSPGARTLETVPGSRR
jgi:multidrug efflux pump subunit AcrB